MDYDAFLKLSQKDFLHEYKELEDAIDDALDTLWELKWAKVDEEECKVECKAVLADLNLVRKRIDVFLEETGLERRLG